MHLNIYLMRNVKGIIKATGVSTHTVEVVDIAGEMDEIDVIHPLFNIKGIWH